MKKTLRSVIEHEKKYKSFGQSPLSVYKLKAHCGKLAYAIQKNPTVNVRLHVMCARVKHSYEISSM